MNQSAKARAYAICIFSYFTIGCMVLTANTAMDGIITEFGWPDSRGALLITFMSIGNLIMSIVGNMLMDKIGRQNAMRLYAALLAAGFALFALAPMPQLYVLFLLMAGIAWGGINNLDNTVVAELYDGSAMRLNLLHAGFSVGAVLFPLIVGFTARMGVSWRVPVLLVVGMSILLFIFSSLVRMPEKTGGEQETRNENIPYWREAGFYLATLTFFLYVGVENSASAWISGYLQRYNAFFSRIPGQTMVSLMWGMMLVGRLFVAAISTKLNKKTLLIGLAACFLAGMSGLVAFCRVTPLVILSVAVMGLGMSAMYGTTVANANRYATGPALGAGIMYGAGGLGSATIPFVAGLVSDAAGLRVAMGSLCMFLTALLISVILSARVKN